MALLKFEGEEAVDFPLAEEDDLLVGGVEEVGLHVGAAVHEGEEDLPPEEEVGLEEAAAPEGEVDQVA